MDSDHCRQEKARIVLEILQSDDGLLRALNCRKYELRACSIMLIIVRKIHNPIEIVIKIVNVYARLFQRDNEVLLQIGYDVIVIFPQGELHAIFHDGF